MGDLPLGISGHEGNRIRQGPVNVEFSRVHEGRGAGKTEPPGGHDLVNRKKNSFAEGKVRGKSMLSLDPGKIGKGPGMMVFWGRLLGPGAASFSILASDKNQCQC